jgi:hypothetical protein
MLNECFDLMECTHWSGWAVMPTDISGAIVVVHGGNEHEHAEAINGLIQPLKWVIFVVIGDEAAQFDHSLINHPNIRRWTQNPKPGVTPKADRYLICGYPNDCREELRQIGTIQKTFDWFFAGQMSHARRHAMGAALDDCGNGLIIPTAGFGQGVNHSTYYRYMAKAKIVPCPSGPETADSYRMAEALEAGAVPILDACALDGRLGYWELVFGKHSFPVIEDWATLPSVMDAVLHDYDRYQRLTQYEWKRYKVAMRNWLAQDLIKVGAL